MTNRSRHEIFASILHSASQESDGIILTKLMYNTFLSYTQIRDHLEELTAFGLVEYRNDTKRYKATAKGHRFLRLVIEMENILKVHRSSDEIGKV